MLPRPTLALELAAALSAALFTSESSAQDGLLTQQEI